MQQLPAALAPLAAYRQFVVYVVVPSQTRPGKTDKFPLDYRTGKMPPQGSGGAMNPEYQTDFATASAMAAQLGAQHGVGFVFTEQDNFWFLDIDNCLIPDNHLAPTKWDWSDLAKQFMRAFAGAAIEISSSGKGLHIIGSGKPPAHKKKNEALGLEFYSEKRFVALTGTSAVGNVSADFSAQLPALVHQFFKPDEVGEFGGWTEGPCEGWRGPVDDDELLKIALRSQSKAGAFGGKATFRDLFERNVESLRANYPDEGREFDESSADAALAQHLAFWTGKDCERILRLMMRSALVRDKWNRDDYLRERTIPNAVKQCREVFAAKDAEQPAHVPTTSEVPSTTGDKIEPVTGSTFMNIDEQMKMFAGCVYVTDAHRVLIPGGQLLKPEQFKVIYGGYSFIVDQSNDRSTRDAFEALTQNQAYRRRIADSTCFKPDMPPGAIIRDAGRSRVNIWWPVDVPRKTGDITPFLTHLAKLLPNERDRAILLAYMCACVQHKGYKFQWAPLLQGVEGNGKTLLTRCVAEAVGRRYVHWPKASKLSKEFNGWMVGKVFYGVEDIYVPDSKREIIEELKPMITGGDGLEIESKGVDQKSDDICGNFMFNSNHKDAIRKTQNDRRFAVFYTAQQTAADLVRDGMHGDYFPKLYAWLREGGYAIVSELLHTYPIPDEFNPATSCQRAPETSSTHAAISASMGNIEQEIVEAVAQGLPGFCGGWVSSLALDKLLEKLGRSRAMSHSKRKELLASLGYMPHPGLADGRTPNAVSYPDNGKPVLFIRSDRPARYIVGDAEIVREYVTSQGPIIFSAQQNAQ